MCMAPESVLTACKEDRILSLNGAMYQTVNIISIFIILL